MQTDKEKRSNKTTGKSKRAAVSRNGSDNQQWEKYQGIKRLFCRIVDSVSPVTVFLMKYLKTSPHSKWRAMQLKYRWELDAHLDAKGHGHGHGNNSQTFDFLGGVTAWGLFRLLVVVFFLGVVIGTSNTAFFYLEHVLHDQYLTLEATWSKDAEGYTYIHWLMGATISGGIVGFITNVYFPECAGSGVDATKICMAVSAPIPAVVSVLRIIFTSIYVAFGNPLDIEAPALHVSASLASSLLRSAARVLPDDFRLEHLPTWVLVGMTTGLATAFGAPLVGMMYAIEEYMNIRKIGLSVVLIGVASTVGVFTSIKIHEQLDDKLNVAYSRDDVLSLDFKTGYGSLLSFLLAFLCAALSQVASKLILRLRHFNNTQLIKYIKPQYHGLIGGFTVGCIGMVVYKLSESKGVWGSGMKTFTELLTLPMCTEEEAGLKRLTITSTPGIFYLQPQSRLFDEPQIFIDPMDDEQCLPFHKLVAVAFGKLLAVCVAVSFRGSGGLFFPTLVIGGSFGGVVGGVFQMLDPTHAIDYHKAILLGMVGFYAALLRTPVTAILLAYDISGYGALGLSIGLTYSMIITSVVAHLLAQAMDSTDLISHMMLQDGIDVKELFRTGLTTFAAETENSHDGLDEDSGKNIDRKQHRQSANSSDTTRRGAAASTPRTRRSKGDTGSEGGSASLSPTRKRRSTLLSENVRGQSDTENCAEEAHHNTRETRRNLEDLKKNVGASRMNMSTRSTSRFTPTDEKTKKDRIAKLDTEIKGKKKVKDENGVFTHTAHKTSVANTILLQAAKRALVEQRIADNKRLHLLAKRSNVQGMHEHLMGCACVDMNWVNPDTRDTCLSQAIDSEIENGVRLLLYKRCDPNFVASKGDLLPILKACKKGLAEAVMALIAYGADQTVKEAHTGNGCLHLAAASGNEKLLRELIQCNASLGDTNSVGDTAIIVAARSRNHSLISILTSESWRIQKGGEERDFFAKYVLKRSRQQLLGLNAPEKHGTGAQSAGNVDLVAQFTEYDPQEGETAWDDERKRITATTLQEFQSKLEAAKVDVAQLQQITLNVVWQLHINLAALMYASDGDLIRHVSMIEVRLLAHHHGQKYVLMEHMKDGSCRYINMIVAVPEHNKWTECATSAMCQNFGVSPDWIQDNLKPLGHEAYAEKLVSSRYPHFHTTYHINCTTFKVIDPRAPAVTEQNFLGLPAAEPFLLNGKVWKWEIHDKSKSLFDWGII